MASVVWPMLATVAATLVAGATSRGSGRLAGTAGLRAHPGMLTGRLIGWDACRGAVVLWRDQG